MPLLSRLAIDRDYNGVARRARQGKLVCADNVARWFWENEKEDWHYDADFGALRLPFDILWIEWQVPDRVFVDGQGRDAVTKRCGVLLEECTSPELLEDCPFPGATRAIAIAAFDVLHPSNEILWYPNWGLIFTDDNGKYVGCSPVTLPESRSPIPPDEIWLVAKPALLAVSLMNCKNVSVEKLKPPPRRTSGRSKTLQRDAVLSYHTIVLPERRSKTVQGISDVVGEVRPMHQVRGHFATYTSEAPLFGKHVGTYWKPWHTRGDLAVGEIRSAYEVEANA